MNLADRYRWREGQPISVRTMPLGGEVLVIESVEPDGTLSVCLYVGHGEADETDGCACSECAPHEQPGRMHRAWSERIHGDALRCGSPCADGHPCRIPVAHHGDRCPHHRDAS